MTELGHFEVDIISNGAHHPRAALVAVAGDLDLRTGPQLRRALYDVLDAGHSDLVLDMADVAFIDAAGVGVLVGVASQAASDGGRLVIRTPSPVVRKVLDLLELNGSLIIEA